MPKKQTQPTLVSNTFLPGSFGFHEIIDRSYVMAEMFAETIASQSWPRDW